MFKVSIRKSGLALGKALSRALPSSGQPRVKVGFPAGEASGSVIERAYFNEFGARGSGKGFSTPRGGGFGGPIPERPFMRSAMRDNEAKYLAGMTKAARRMLLSTAAGGDLASEMRTTLRQLGIMAQGDIQESITSWSSPPNSETTIRLKGSSNPLIDSGEMRQAVAYRVEE